MKKKQKNKKKKDPSLHFVSPNHELSPLSSLFRSRPIGFPSKMMPCKLNHNLICFDLEPLSKGLGTNLKLLTNRKNQFHWTLLLGPLVKVAIGWL
jgi:hypothetical protein